MKRETQAHPRQRDRHPGALLRPRRGRLCSNAAEEEQRQVQADQGRGGGDERPRRRFTSGKLAGGLDAGRLAADSVTGAQVDEASLEGINAATVGGMEVKKIDFRVPYGTSTQPVLVYPGIFRIDAQCQSFGDVLDVAALTFKDGSTITETAMYNGNGATDDDGSPDIAARHDTTFNTNEAFEVDNTSEMSSASNATIHYDAPGGFTVTTTLQMQTEVSGCTLTGLSVGG
jgi:hypothetical protein